MQLHKQAVEIERQRANGYHHLCKRITLPERQFPNGDPFVHTFFENTGKYILQQEKVVIVTMTGQN